MAVWNEDEYLNTNKNCEKAERSVYCWDLSMIEIRLKMQDN